MAWYTTGTIAVSGTTVTGTGTNWLDNKQSIGAGQALLIPGSGTVKMYEIASVTSATKLTLKTSPGTIASGQAYAILSFYTDSVPDFARRLAAQLSYYQSQMDGWQQIMTGTGSINMTAPDGTTVTISSFSKLTADVAAAMTDKGNLTSTVDLNTLGAAASWGVYTQTANANALVTLNYPEQKAGTLLCTKAAYNGVIQTYIPFDSGQIYTRALSGNWNGTDGPWREWQTVGYSSQTGQFTGDCNTLTSSGRWSISSSATNQAVASTPGTLLVQRRTSATDLYQEFIAIGSSAGATNRRYQRTLSGTTWSAWAEVMTSNTTVPLANGGLGQPASSIADFRAKLGVGWTTSIANPGSGIYRVLNYDDSGLMTIMRRFSVTVAANSTGTFSYNWQTELGVVFQAYPAMAINGVGGFSNFWKIGVEGGDGSQVSGYVFNTNSSSITVWITVLAIGIKG